MTQTIDPLNEAYLTLARDRTLWQLPLEAALSRILATVRDALQVQRVGIWLLDEGGSRLTCRLLLDDAPETADCQTVFYRDDYRDYFTALDAGRVIDACDALTDTRTSEYAETYLRPRGIGAMLDASLHMEARTCGVLCAEHIGASRPWSGREVAFAVSVADLISRLMVSDDARRADHRATEEQLRNVTAFQQAILDGASHAIIYTNSAGVILSFNAGAERMLGFTADEVVWKHGPAVFCEPDELEAIRREIARRLEIPFHPHVATMLAGVKSRLQMEWETVYTRKNGERFPALLTLTSQHGADGTLSGFVAIVADISDRKRAESLAKHEQELIVHIMQGTSGATGDAFFDTLTLELVRALGVEVAFVAEYLPGAEPTARTVGYAKAGTVRPSATFALSGSAAARVIAEGSFYCERGAWSRFPRNQWLKEERISGYLGTRLDATDGSPLGILVVADTGPLADPTLADHLVRIFAVRAAAELERIRAEQELVRSRAELLERNALLRLLNRLSERLNEMLDENVIAQETVALLEESKIAPHVGLFLLSEDRKSLRLARSAASTDNPDIFSTALPLEKTAASEAFRTGNIFFAEDIREGMAHFPQRRDELLAMGIRAILVIPLIYRGQPLGTVALGYQTPPLLTPETRENYRALGQAVGLALANARHLTDLDFQAHHDALTRLPNRLILHRELAGLGQTSFKPGEVSALLLLDLDRFKEINDTLGHDMGDRLLNQIGPRLDAAIREKSALLCRLGGDEFAILLRHLTDEGQAYFFAQRLLAELKKPFPIDDMNLEIGGSIGIAFHPAHGETSHDLLRSADVAMYQAKRSGMGVFVYDRMMDRHSPQRLAIMNDLRHAIDAGEMSLRYQPRLEIETDKIIGYEALVRWQHPRYGLLMPDQFIGLAEMGDTIHALTDHVLELAIQDLAGWRAKALPETLPWSVSVNLSARDLIDNRVAQVIERLLEKYGIEPSRLELELTETALMQDPATAALVLNRIAALGVRIAIDDFGTGYSSLSYLRRLPIYALKIARDFIHDMVRNNADTIIVRSTIQLGHNLGLVVVAESVEDETTLEYLRALGCDQAQGNFIRPPVAAGEVL